MNMSAIAPPCELTPPPASTTPPPVAATSADASSATDVQIPAPNPFNLQAYSAKCASMHPRLLWALRCIAYHTRGGVHLRPNQERALCGILNIPQNERMSLVVQRTGGGKTLVVQILGAVLKGITYICSPLLGLTSNLAPRFASDNMVCGAVDAIHLDEEATTPEKLNNLVAGLDKKETSTNNTTFILSSPQFLLKHPTMKEALLRALDRKLLRAVVCDEAHLLALQGSDFRDEIRTFSRTFLQEVLSHPNHPYFVGLSATVTKHNLYWLEQLLGRKISPYGKLWDTAVEFQQRNISITLDVTSKYKSQAAKSVSKFFSDIDDSDESMADAGAVVFVNSRNICREVVEAIESTLDKDGNDHIDVVSVHGHMEKEEKFFNLCLFCNNEVIDGFNTASVRCFTSTSACDHGIDHKNVRFLMICEWPESIAIFIQRKGRAVRLRGDGECMLVVCFENFVYLFIRSAMRAFDSFKDDAETEHTWSGTNTILSPRSKKRKVDKTDVLTLQQRRMVARTQCDDLMDVARLVCMDHGCWQQRLELYCQNGVYTSVSSNPHVCGSKCPHCRRAEFNSVCRRVDVVAMKSFLDSGYVRDLFPMDATIAKSSNNVTTHSVDTDPLINVIWRNDSVMTNIYDVKPSTVKKKNVEMLLLAMICNGIITIDVDSNGSARFLLARVVHHSSTYPVECYKLDEYWVGINQYKASRKRAYPVSPIVPNGSNEATPSTTEQTESRTEQTEDDTVE